MSTLAVPAPADPAQRASPGVEELMRPAATAYGAAGVVRLAPTARECRTAGWLDDTAARLVRELGPEGIAYVVPPRGWRGRAAASLRAAGLVVGPPAAHLHVGTRDRWVVPLGRDEVRFLLERVLSLPMPVRRLGPLLARLPGWRAVVAELWPAVGMAARRPEARPPYAWLEGLGAPPAARVVTVRGWRGADDSVLLHLFDAGGAHAAVAKLARAGAAADEAAVLQRVGCAARAAGAVVPHVLGAGEAAGRRVVVLSAVAGTRAADRVRGRARAADAALERVAGWLELWNRATARVAPLRADELEREVLGPLARLAPLLADGEAYAARVRALCGRVAGTELPRVAAHGDLTLHNVLLHGGTLGVVDWEAAREDGWPLTDLEYAAVDAAAAARGYRDRPGAWSECHLAGGPFAGRLAASRARTAEALRLPPDFAALCHHACWLHHAANEHAEAPAGERPFLRILGRVAEQAEARS